MPGSFHARVFDITRPRMLLYPQHSAIRRGGLVNASVAQYAIAEEDRLRADLYAFLARHLAAAPGVEDLAGIAGLQGDDSDLGRAFADLAQAAGHTAPATVSAEYDALFIGIGRGELVPFGSYYLTGFLNEKPLARLRESLAALGIARSSAVKEPEDHIATLMEVMSGLIGGAYGTPASLAAQQGFFDAHVAPWAAHFFTDLQKAKAADFYRPVGRIGELLTRIESAAFAMD